MPKLKNRDQLSAARKKLEPQRDNSKLHDILNFDLSGWRQGRIAEAIGLSQSRVSIIMNSPIYKERRNELWANIEKNIVAKKTNDAAKGDPVVELFKNSALDAARAKVLMSQEAESEFVRNSAISEVLNRAGYKEETKRTTTSIEVSEKIATRFEEALRHGQSGTPTVKMRVETIRED